MTSPEGLSQLEAKPNPIKPDKVKPQSRKFLTVEQYLRRAKLDQAIADLIRSLHKTSIMSFADWDKQMTALLKKKIW